MNFFSDNDHIIISAAVKEELELLRLKLLNPKAIFINNIEISTGTINDKNVMLIATGPGVVNTAHALTVVLEKTKAALIIQTGCAGAFKNAGIKKGDIGIATCEIDIHTGIESDKNHREIPSPLPFPIVSKNNTEITNTFPTDQKMSENAFNILSDNMGRDQKIRLAPFVTVSTITATDNRAGILYEAFMPCMESMEGASAAHIAFLYDIPFIEIRSASNIVGKRDKSQWDLPLAFKNSNLAVLEFINGMGETID